MPVTKPTVVPQWSSAADGSSPVNIVEPLAGKLAVGFQQEEKPPAEYLNWLLYRIFLWCLWLQDITNQALTWTGIHQFNTTVTFAGSAIFDGVASFIGSVLVAGRLAFSSVGYVRVPDVWFHESWLHYVDGTGGSATANPMWEPWSVVYVSVGSNYTWRTALPGSDCHFPQFEIKPGDANTNDISIVMAKSSAPNVLVAYSGAMFDTASSGMFADEEWKASLSVKTADNTTWYMGFTNAAETDRAFKWGASDGLWVGFRRASADTAWQCVTHDAAGETATSTGVTLAANFEWHTFRIVYDTTTPSVLFYLDGVLKATHTTHLPAMGARLGFSGKRSAGSATSFILIGPVNAGVDANV